MAATENDAGPEEPLPTTCEGCAFWDAYDPDFAGARGLCRVNPPTIDVDGAGVWPQTAADDWCGDFMSPDEKP